MSISFNAPRDNIMNKDLITRLLSAYRVPTLFTTCRTDVSVKFIKSDSDIFESLQMTQILKRLQAIRCSVAHSD